MPTVHTFQVVPSLPEPLRHLRALAYNLQWSWNLETLELFRRLDRSAWEASGHNPVLMLGTVAQDRLRDAANDDNYLSMVEGAFHGLETYVRSTNTWYRRNHHHAPLTTCIAYFCMEFGITECLPIYSGGLGVLAGDHMKSSSDLGLPLVGVGLLYQQGYFRQFLNVDGWQQERYPVNDFYNMPLQPVMDDQGQQVRVEVQFPGRTVTIQVWKVVVGRVPLFLLDTNLSVNRPEDQNITDQLYGGDSEMRLKQEIILGIGGQRALQAMGISPRLCHMNEGHSAFQALERARRLMQEHSCAFAVAREAGAAGNLFTTHTPVPAGFDVFTPGLLAPYFSDYVTQLGITFDEFLEMGRVNREDRGENFNMAVLALRTSHHVNAVSKLHGEVTRRMVQAGYRDLPEDEVPVSHVTNGIHARSFVSREMADLLDRYLGGRWSQDVSDPEVWSRVDDIPAEELWRVKQFRRDRLVHFARTRLYQQYKHFHHSDSELRRTKEVLNPDILTIGFARRFATYKRATLLLSDQDRLLRLLNDPNRPIQIIMAGKSHPHDDGGKELIRQVVQFAHRPEARNRIVFLEDYDLAVARFMVQGVDVWLNTPRRPMEASGTSGMKVLANGGINCSILDGWWDEAYTPSVGWAIGSGEEYDSPQDQDAIEANALFDLLEKEIAPLFYDRAINGLPNGWIARMKSSMRHLCPVFNTHRMVGEYASRFYVPGIERYDRLSENALQRASQLVDWKDEIRKNWPQVKVVEVKSQLSEGSAVTVGANVQVTAKLNLASLTPHDVYVQAHHGPLDSSRQVMNGSITNLECTGAAVEGIYTFEGTVPCLNTGLQGFSVRVVPQHPDAELPQELALIAWE